MKSTLEKLINCKTSNCILKIPSKGLFPPELELYEKCLVNLGNATYVIPSQAEPPLACINWLYFLILCQELDKNGTKQYIALQMQRMGTCG